MNNETPNLHYPITNGRFIDVTDQDFFFSRDFAPAEFRERRKRVAAAIGPDAHADGSAKRLRRVALSRGRYQP